MTVSATNSSNFSALAGAGVGAGIVGVAAALATMYTPDTRMHPAASRAPVAPNFSPIIFVSRNRPKLDKIANNGRKIRKELL